MTPIDLRLLNTAENLMYQAKSLNATTLSQQPVGSAAPNQSATGFPRVFKLPAGTYMCNAYGFVPKPAGVDSTIVSAVGGLSMTAANDPRMEEVPHHPTRIKDAVRRYLDAKRVDGANAPRVLVEKERLLTHLVEFCARARPCFDDASFVHEIGARDIEDFVVHLRNLSGKDRTGDGKPTKSAPRTVEKKLRMLIDFFNYCVKKLQSTVVSPAACQLDVARQLKIRSEREGRRYSPFTDVQITTIFSPEVYLQRMRQPDLFWIPILSAHLAVRAGELVQAKVCDVGCEEPHGTWYIDIHQAHAKNSNSVRRLPITEPLIRLGFIEYVLHVESLGADLLFPHRDYSTRTLSRDPSKRVSERFASLLDTHEIVDVDLVFHSFRHTVVCALHDANVPFTDALMICGHEAQDNAIRQGVLKKRQARSVNVRVYAHPDKPRLNAPSALIRHKAQLEFALQLPLDYPRLRIAADIVREHLRKEPSGFLAGWPPQNRRYTGEQLLRLNAPGAAL